MVENKKILLSASTGDESSDPISLFGNGAFDIIVSGDMTGATVQIETEGAGGWSPISGGLFEELESRTLVRIPKSRRIRATVVGACEGVYVEITL